MGVGSDLARSVACSPVLSFLRWQRWEKSGPFGRPRWRPVKGRGWGPKKGQAPGAAVSSTIFTGY